MGNPKKPSPIEPPKPPNGRKKTQPPPTGNKRIAEQTRKALGKHYASKYQTR